MIIFILVKIAKTVSIIMNRNNYTAQKMEFSIKDFFSKCGFPADLVTFTEVILNGKLHFLCSVITDNAYELRRKQQRKTFNQNILKL